ncbi:hypothetical protein CDAR_554061 [Caerostris darwini]|uniref:Uncharacterized protein n=1 Tax=Caerostris darwini TaxID=1538125 RepID=A0AAV4X3U2_9ARAC|nr:hypothetical protein CDAR_554061 [Caerostris darwini]
MNRAPSCPPMKKEKADMSRRRNSSRNSVIMGKKKEKNPSFFWYSKIKTPYSHGGSLNTPTPDLNRPFTSLHRCLRSKIVCRRSSINSRRRIETETLILPESHLSFSASITTKRDVIRLSLMTGDSFGNKTIVTTEKYENDLF